MRYRFNSGYEKGGVGIYSFDSKDRDEAFSREIRFFCFENIKSEPHVSMRSINLV